MSLYSCNHTFSAENAGGDQSEGWKRVVDCADSYHIAHVVFRALIAEIYNRYEHTALVEHPHIRRQLAEQALSLSTLHLLSYF